VKEEFYLDNVIEHACSLFKRISPDCVLPLDEQLEKAINLILDYVFQTHKSEIQFGVYAKSRISFILTKHTLNKLGLTPSAVLYHMVDLNTVLHTKPELEYICFEGANRDTIDPTNILEVHLNFEEKDE
jgi:hypothetical protein